eukprot:TRINITY_DN28261_c0_g1_i3.p1 TRINITY_DN28261_c0_g1~~TRINITY_DN28261_c0_g1_i3.p1  ORF type:complete len:592 (-),score=115.29 TRINITY_DN28261_c0_g1_i3:241-2016(-)
MDYYKNLVPSQLIAERGSDIVVINPGSENVRIGLASWPAPVTVPHCLAHRMNSPMDEQALRFKTNREQVYRKPLSPLQQQEREEAYKEIESELRVQSPNHDLQKQFCLNKGDYIDGYNSQRRSYEDQTNPWTRAKENKSNVLPKSENANKCGEEDCMIEIEDDNNTLRTIIYGEEAMRISPSQPYIMRRPIRRGHFNISQFYSMQQILEDIYRIWDWILKEKCNLPLENRRKVSAVLVLSESFDVREIKEMVSVILHDLQFEYVVVHQESLAAISGNGVGLACVVNIGAQVTSILCIEDGVTLASSGVILPYGGEDISRSLLWVQQHRLAWPSISTDPMSRPIDLQMLNKLKEKHCMFREGDCDALDEISFSESHVPIQVYQVNLSALNIPPMGLFLPSLFLPDEYPAPPRPWSHDYEDVLEDSSHTEFTRKLDAFDTYISGNNYGMTMSELSEYNPFQFGNEDNCVGLAEAITRSILSIGRIDVEKKLFSSILLVGGVALTEGLVGTLEDKVLEAIPSNESIETVEVLQHKSDPINAAWKGGAILGILDLNRESWIRRDDWVSNGIHIGSGRKYKDSTILQAQPLWFINS